MKNKKKEIQKLTLFNLKLLIPLLVILAGLFLFTALRDSNSFKDSNFSVNYPKSWKSERDKRSPLAQGVFLKGSEGSIHILSGSGFGGGCNPENVKEITIGGSRVSSCLSVDANGQENWAVISNLNNKTFAIIAKINQPFESNRKTIFDVFSSFKPR